MARMLLIYRAERIKRPVSGRLNGAKYLVIIGGGGGRGREGGQNGERETREEWKAKQILSYANFLKQQLHMCQGSSEGNVNGGTERAS